MSFLRNPTIRDCISSMADGPPERNLTATIRLSNTVHNTYLLLVLSLRVQQMEPMDCPKTSVNNYQHSLLNIPFLKHL